MRRLTNREMRTIQLGLLRGFADYAEKEGLTWFLCAGTLLGAARHKGFIPWDDDVDVMLPRADYERLCQEFSDSAVDGVQLACLATDRNYPFPYAKWHDSRTRVIERYDPAPDYGVCIDIFPIDEWPRSGMNSWVLRNGLLALRWILGTKIAGNYPKRSRWKNSLLRLGKFFLGPVPAQIPAQAMTSLVRNFPIGTSTRSGVIVWGYMEQVPSECYSGTAQLNFEGQTYPVPSGWKQVLRSLYGDYNTPPPPEKQVSHHYFEAYIDSTG